MALPISWVDSIFERLTVRYGGQFLSRWDGVDLGLVRQDWAEVLGGFEANPSAIAYALEHIDVKWPPTATEFRELALEAPVPAPLGLPAPAEDPARVEAARARAKAAVTRLKAGTSKRWAAELRAVELHQDGIMPFQKLIPRPESCRRMTAFARGAWRAALERELAAEAAQADADAPPGGGT